MNCLKCPKLVTSSQAWQTHREKGVMNLRGQEVDHPTHPPEPEAKPFPKGQPSPRSLTEEGGKFLPTPGWPPFARATRGPSLLREKGDGLPSRESFVHGKGGGGRTPLPISPQTPTHLLVWKVYSNSKQPNFWLGIIIGPILDQANTRPWVQF